MVEVKPHPPGQVHVVPLVFWPTEGLEVYGLPLVELLAHRLMLTKDAKPDRPVVCPEVNPPALAAQEPSAVVPTSAVGCVPGNPWMRAAPPRYAPVVPTPAPAPDRTLTLVLAFPAALFATTAHVRLPLTLSKPAAKPEEAVRPEEALFWMSCSQPKEVLPVPSSTPVCACPKNAEANVLVPNTTGMALPPTLTLYTTAPAELPSPTCSALPARTAHRG